MNNKILKKFKIPDKPGVYFFLRDKEILYIGKATSLKDRVKSYFSKDLIETRGPIILDMVFKADKIKWQTTDSVLEALILEASLIKKHQPYYNTREKDDRSFNYVCITKEKLPRVIVVRGRNVQHSVFNKVFGPYPNGLQLREAMKIVRRIFPFLDEKSKNYLEFYRQINLVPDLNDYKIYRQNIKNIILFFEGKKKKILKNLQKEMKEYAKKREFEKAGEIKRQIFALKHINDVALLKNYKEKQDNFSRLTLKGSDTTNNYLVSPFRIEGYDIAHLGGKNMVGVMVVVVDGEVEKSEYKKFKIRTQDNAPARRGGNDTGALKEVLERRLAHTEWTYPDLIVVDGSTAQINTAKTILNKFGINPVRGREGSQRPSASNGINIPIVSVVKDEHHKARAIMGLPAQTGNKNLGLKYKKEILLVNSEAHRFAINYHKNMRNRNFLK